MRILHFIPEITENIDVRKEFLMHLMSMKDGTEMRILTTENNTGLDNAEKLPKLLPLLGKRVGRAIEEFHPDIIHIHGCTGHIELKVFRTAEKYRIPVIVSPSGSLAAITLTERSAVKQLTSDASRARKMIWGADAIHVTGELEMETVRKMQIIPGKDIRKDIIRKTFMIKNCVLTNAISDDEMRNSFVSLYRKVAFWRAFDVMLPETKLLEKVILRTGVCPEYYVVTDQDRELAARTGRDELEKIFVHAETENVRDFIDRGCRTLGINFTPDSNECRTKAGIEECSANKNATLTDNLEKVKSKHYKILRDFENYGEETELFCIIYAAQGLLQKGLLSYRNLAELCHKLITTNYREDIVLKLFRDTKIIDFASRLMHVTSEYTGLPEGFMPVNPINDDKTKYLFTFLTLKSR